MGRGKKLHSQNQITRGCKKMIFFNQGNIFIYLECRHFKYQIFSTKPCGSQEIYWKYPILFDHAKRVFLVLPTTFNLVQRITVRVFFSIRGDCEEHNLAELFLSIEYWKQVILRSNSKRFSSFSLCLPVYRPSKSQNLPPKSHNCARPNVFTKENVQCKYIRDNNKIFKYGVGQQYLRKTNI